MLKFKLAIWLDGYGRERSKGFLDLRFDRKTIDAFKRLGELYLDLNTTEIWTDRTAANVLKQIESSYLTNSIAYPHAVDVTKTLENVLSSFLDFAEKGVKRHGTLSLYHSDYLMMTNSALLSSTNGSAAYTSYAGANYFRTDKEDFVKNMHSWFQVNINKSKYLGGTGLRELEGFRSRLFKMIAHTHSSIDLASEKHDVRIDRGHIFASGPLEFLSLRNLFHHGQGFFGRISVFAFFGVDEGTVDHEASTKLAVAGEFVHEAEPTTVFR